MEKNKCGGFKRNPFVVPEGYFAQLKSDVMASVQEDRGGEDSDVPAKKTVWRVVSPYFYMAAMFAGMALFFKCFPIITDSIRSERIAEVPIALVDRSTELPATKVEITPEDYSDYLIASSMGFSTASFLFDNELYQHN